MMSKSLYLYLKLIKMREKENILKFRRFGVLRIKLTVTIY